MNLFRRLHRYWKCYRGQLIRWRSAKEIAPPNGIVFFRRYGLNYRDFREYWCERCNGFHVERVVQ